MYRTPNPLAPYFVPVEQMMTGIIVILVVIGAIIGTLIAIVWTIQTIARLGRRNAQSRKELSEVLRYRGQGPKSGIRSGQSSDRRGLSSPPAAALARSLAHTMKGYFKLYDFSLWVKEPNSIEGLIAWLRTAQRRQKTLLVALIHNRIGCRLAKEGELTEAIVHFENARNAFDNLPPDMTEGQAMVIMLEQLRECGNRQAEEELPRVREGVVQYEQFVRAQVLDVILRNLNATRIRLAAPVGLEAYLEACEANNSVDAAMLLGRALAEFEEKLAGKWYQWPIAAVKHDLVIASIWVTGVFGDGQAEVLQEAQELAERTEVPYDSFRQQIRDTVEIAHTHTVNH